MENHLENDKRKTKGDLQEEDGDRDGDVESHSVNQLLEQDDRQATEGESQKEDAAGNLGEDAENELEKGPKNLMVMKMAAFLLKSGH